MIDLPILAGAASPNFDPDWLISPTFNRLTIDGNSRIVWNGEPVTVGELVKVLSQTKEESPQPYLLFEPEPDARYDLVAKTLNIIFRTGLADSKFCILGMEMHRDFGKDMSGANPTNTARRELRLYYTLVPHESEELQFKKIVTDIPALAEECDALAQLP